MEIIMELILISNTKLKIMLDESDMQKYHIGSESDCAEISTRKAIRSLLECARDQIGFNTDGEEIFVQLYTSKHGGCELFVTKCMSGASSCALPERIKSQVTTDERAREKRTKPKPSLPEPKAEKERSEGVKLPSPTEKSLSPKRNDLHSRIAFSFSRVSDLIRVCKILKENETSTESRAFCDEDGNFYLLLLGTGMSAYSRLDRLTFIHEYGKRENPDCLIPYISEHGRVVCQKNAVETLAQL